MENNLRKSGFKLSRSTRDNQRKSKSRMIALVLLLVMVIAVIIIVDKRLPRLLENLKHIESHNDTIISESYPINYSLDTL